MMSKWDEVLVLLTYYVVRWWKVIVPGILLGTFFLGGWSL